MLTRRTGEVTDALQNVILQHADIRTFIRHYEVDVDVDVQGIIRKTGSQTPLVRFACSLSASIDPDRPYWLSADESKSLNQLPEISKRQQVVVERKEKWKNRESELACATLVLRASFGQLSDEARTYRSRQLQEKIEDLQDRVLEAKRKYNKSVREVRNEKQRQRNRRIRENLKRYRNEQPVIDLERQLAGKLVNTKVMDALEQRGSMPRQQMLMIDAIFTMPGATLEVEQRRQINAINAVTAFCSVEEGRPTRRPVGPGRQPAPECDESYASVKRQRICADDEIALRQAVESVRVTSPKQRPRICFLCLGNPDLPLKDRLLQHTTPGSLTRHFLRKHVNPPWPDRGCDVKSVMERHCNKSLSSCITRTFLMGLLLEA